MTTEEIKEMIENEGQALIAMVEMEYDTNPAWAMLEGYRRGRQVGIEREERLGDALDKAIKLIGVMNMPENEPLGNNSQFHLYRERRDKFISAQQLLSSPLTKEKGEI